MSTVDPSDDLEVEIRHAISELMSTCGYTEDAIALLVDNAIDDCRPEQGKGKGSNAPSTELDSGSFCITYAGEALDTFVNALHALTGYTVNIDGDDYDLVSVESDYLVVQQHDKYEAGANTSPTETFALETIERVHVY